MAYGSWKSEIETEVWKNSNFRITVKWDYRQDPIANKTEYRTKKVKVYAVNSYDSFYNDSAVAGAAVITETRKTQKVNASIPKGGSQEFNVTDDSRSFSHQADGTMPTVNYNVHGYFDAGLGGDYGTPTGGWKVKAINSHISKIDRATGTTTVSVSSKTYNSITVKLSTVHHSKPTGRYRLNGGSWVNFSASADVQKSGGGSQTLTISGLSPNTTYKIEAQYQRVHNDLWNTAGSASATTNKPSAGNASNISISVTSKTYNSITVKLSGGSPGAGASLSYYRINFNGGGYKRVSNPVTFSGLSPNTTYTIRADFVDNYGTTANNSSSISVTTNKPNAPTKGKVTANDITSTSAKFTISGFSFGAGATWGKYQWSTNNSTWTDIGSNTSFSRTGLTPDTSYTTYVRLVDNYGTTSAVASVTFTTVKPGDPSGGYINVTNVTPFQIDIEYGGFMFPETRRPEVPEDGSYQIKIEPTPIVNDLIGGSFENTDLPSDTVINVGNFSSEDSVYAFLWGGIFDVFLYDGSPCWAMFTDSNEFEDDSPMSLLVYGGVLPEGDITISFKALRPINNNLDGNIVRETGLRVAVDFDVEALNDVIGTSVADFSYRILDDGWMLFSKTFIKNGVGGSGRFVFFTRQIEDVKDVPIFIDDIIVEQGEHPIDRYMPDRTSYEWISKGTETSHSFTDLTPETDYKISVKAYGSYGRERTISIEETTLTDQTKIYIKDGTMKKGKVWFNQNGTWKKAKKIFVKDTIWKKHIN